MTDINPQDLIAKFQYALDNNFGYIMYMKHEYWSESKQKAYNEKYKDNEDCQISIKYGDKWYGFWVTDCSGLFSWAFEELGGYMYHGSNTMWDKYCTAQGELIKGKRDDGQELKAGTAVFCYNKDTGKRGHVGLFVGDCVIEAAGAKSGVITSKITDKKWVEWGELKGVDYEADPEPVPAGYAIVTGKNLALRQGPSTSCKVITRAPTGSRVKITEPPSEWEYVTYNGKQGYMMKQYLKEG
jgi:uncharacterized protein YgiM (DUF1202 family)